jgi:hypothetical protein
MRKREIEKEAQEIEGQYLSVLRSGKNKQFCKNNKDI